MRQYTSLEVSRLTGATLRQLQWWDEQNYVPARRGRKMFGGRCVSGPGEGARLFSEAQLFDIRVLVLVSRKHDRLVKKIEPVLSKLHGQRYLVVCDRGPFWFRTEKQMLNFSVRVNSGVVMIPLPSYPVARTHDSRS